MSRALALFVLVGCTPRAEVQTANDLSLDGVTRLVVRTAAGDVSLSPGQAGALHAAVTRAAYTESAARALPVDVHSDGTQAIVQWNGPSEDNQSVSFAITAPADLTVDIESGAGDLRVDGQAAPVRAHTGAGNIMLLGALSGESFAHTGAGDIAVTVAAGSRLAVSAHTAAGTAKNDFGMPITGGIVQQGFNGAIGDGGGGTLDLDTGAGNVDLYEGR
jgi:hypothetical protein